MKVKVLIKQEVTATLNIGDFTPSFIKSLLEAHEGSLDGNYGLGDFTREDYKVTSVEVTEVK
jgi:hypothetical protein